MLLLLPALTLFFTVCIIAGERARKGEANPWASGIVIALLAFSGYVFITTEILSLLHWISRSGVVLTWSVALSFTLNVWFKRGKIHPHKPFFRNFDPLEKFLALALAVILFFTCLIAVTAFPNNWDSMTYHLSRVMFWIQNGNVNHYPTEVDRQISQPPLAEYFILQFRLLSNRDAWANMVQWMCMCGSLCAVALITSELGGKRKPQLLAAFFAACIPMGILQSTSTQNDYVESFFIAGAVCFLLRILKRGQAMDYILFLAAGALAAATKGTAYIFLLPLFFVFLFPWIRHFRKQGIRAALFGLLFIVTFWLPFALRNEITFHNPLGPDYDLQNNAFGLAPALSGLVKNTTMHFRTPFPPVNTALTRCVTSFHRLIGIDIQSPAYNWQHSPAFSVGYFSTHEDYAGNALHVLFFIICFCIFLSRKDLRRQKYLRLLLVICIAQYILFCAVLKWQVWNSRLQLPLFLLITPFLAVIFRKAMRKKYLTEIMSGIFFASALVFVFFNQSRPLLARRNIFNTAIYNQYFTNNRALQDVFFKMSGVLLGDNLHKLGWISTGDTWQYPMWVLMQSQPGFTMQHILVDNDSKKYEDKKPFSSFIPDAIIVTRFPPGPDKSMDYKGYHYYLRYQNGNWCLYEKQQEPVHTRSV